MAIMEKVKRICDLELQIIVGLPQPALYQMSRYTIDTIACQAVRHVTGIYLKMLCYYFMSCLFASAQD